MIPPTVNVADCPVESIPPLVLRKSSFILKVHPIQGLETFYGLQINRMARKDTFNQRGRVKFDRVWMDVVYTRQYFPNNLKSSRQLSPVHFVF